MLIVNYFHLLLEKPEPNLVTGMKFLLGTFSQGSNARRTIIAMLDYVETLPEELRFRR